MRAGAALLLGLAAVQALGCNDGASPDTGLGALMRLSAPNGVQFIPGELGTEPRAAAPTMGSINVSNNIVAPGAVGRSLGGSANGSYGVLIGLVGDTGHWVVPTGIPDSDVVGAFDFSTTMSFSPLLPLQPDTRSIVFRAVDVHGTVGPPLSLPIKVKTQALTGAGGQPLVVTVRWDTEADLDLKLRVPNAANPAKPIDVWNKSPVALAPVPNGDPPHTDDEVNAAGKLDFDSNAQCVLDGLRQEDVIFPAPPPSGDYQVHVDAFSLCGQVAARWHAYAVAHDDQNGDRILGDAYGQVGDVDTQGTHGPATGTLAFTFTVP